MSEFRAHGHRPGLTVTDLGSFNARRFGNRANPDTDQRVQFVEASCGAHDRHLSASHAVLSDYPED